jgi:hypothetical protein
LSHKVVSAAVFVGLTGPAASAAGGAPVFTAVVQTGSGALVAGSVQFEVDGAGYGPLARLSGGRASLALRGLAAGRHSVRARFAGNDALDGASSGAVAHSVAAGPAVSLGVKRVRDARHGAQLLTVTAKALADGYSPAGRKVRAVANGKTVAKAVTDSSGRAVLRVAESALRLGPNRVVVRFAAGPGAGAAAVSKGVTVRVERRAAVRLTVSLALDGRSGELVVTAAAKSRAEGYRAADRAVSVRAHGRVVARARTDRGGRAVLVLAAGRGSGLSQGANPLVVRFEPGSKRYLKAVSRTLLVTVSRGRITETRWVK